MGTFTIFDHTADVGLEVRADTLADLLATAARATFDQMLEDWPAEVEMMREVRAAPDPGLKGDLGELLVVWLQELLFCFETERRVPLTYAFDIAGPDEVRAEVGFGQFVAGRHRTRLEIKAVTYHELRVEQRADGTWLARFILDV
jgi:SHS2 domain-containing protein